MTDDQKRAALAAELARGDDAIEEAELLVGAGKLAGAVSRAHYGAFHHARTLDVVRAGRLPPEVAALLSRLMTFRQDADYTAEYVFTLAMAQQSASSRVTTDPTTG